MRRLVLLIGFMLAPFCVWAECFDVSKSEPRELSGILSQRIFAGPPAYEDVDKGDAPEPGYVLKLPAPICLTGDQDFTDPTAMFDEVQLVARDATSSTMEAFDGLAVRVRLSGDIPAHTGHHHRPLVAWVDEIVATDIAGEGETAASTVRAFYRALGAGDGVAASAHVVEEKRRRGPFSARELSRFYGALAESLELASVERAGPDSFKVRYRYATRSRVCDGTALVHTVLRRGRYFIKTIKAEDGC